MRRISLPLALSAAAGGLPPQGQGMFTAPQQINLGGDVRSFAVSEDELHLVFATGRPGTLGLDLWETRRTAIGSAWIPPSWLSWPTPSPMSVLNSPADDYDPEMSADGLELYFASTRPGGPGPANLWVSYSACPTGPWCPPQPVAGAVNQPGVLSEAPRLTEDGLTMFFTVTNPLGSDIFTVTRPSTLPTATWGNRQPFTPANDPMAMDHSPLPLANGDVVFFASDRAGSSGSDFWLTWRTGPTSYATPVRVTDLSTGDRDGPGELGWTTGAFYSVVHPTGQPSGLWIRCPVPDRVGVDGMGHQLGAEHLGLTTAPFLVWTRHVQVPIPTGTPMTVMLAVVDWRCPPPPTGLLLAGFQMPGSLQPFPVPGVSGVLAISGPVVIGLFGIPASGTALFPIAIPPNAGLRGLNVLFQYVAVVQLTPLDAFLSQVLQIELL